jgi:hypothetical protein
MRWLVAVGAVMAALAYGTTSAAGRRRRGRAWSRLGKAVGRTVTVSAEGSSIEAPLYVVGTLESVSEEDIELRPHGDPVPWGAGRYAVGPATLRIPRLKVIDVSCDGETIHTRW